MFATVRRYSGVSPEAGEELARRREEIQALVSAVPGFWAYHLLRTSDGVASVTVCADEAAVVEAGRRVAAWIRAHLPGLLPRPPEIAAGEVLIHAGR